MKQTETETKRDWLTTNEVAVRLVVDPSRIRQLILKDQEHAQEQRVFPSARKATEQEAKALVRSGRVRRVPCDGIWLIATYDVATSLEKRGMGLFGGRSGGRSPRWKEYYAGCVWFYGMVAPAEEALCWVCDGHAACITAMLSAPLRRYYERCVPSEMQIDGWDVMEPRFYTEVVREAYVQHSYGKIACVLAPFHDALHLATVITQVERVWRGLSL